MTLVSVVNDIKQRTILTVSSAMSSTRFLTPSLQTKMATHLPAHRKQLITSPKRGTFWVFLTLAAASAV